MASDEPDEENLALLEQMPKLSYHDVIVKYGQLTSQLHFMEGLEFRDYFNKDLQRGFELCKFVLSYKMQRYCLPYLFEKNHVVIHAENGSGKTIVALMVILAKITKADLETTATAHAAVVCRTRHTAQKTFDVLEKMTQFCPQIQLQLDMKKGGKPCAPLNKSVIVGTADKILEFSSHTKNGMCMLVIDEIEAVESDRSYYNRVIELSKALMWDKVIILSAAPPGPVVNELVEKVTTVCPYSLEFPFCCRKYYHKQIFVVCSSIAEKRLLVESCRTRKGQIIFLCKSRDMCAIVASILQQLESCVMLHGKINHKKQDEIIHNFKQNVYRILVTTHNFARIKTAHLRTVVNCDELLTPDKCNIDHAAYQKHMALFSNKKLGYLVNVISPKWDEYARNQNGTKLGSVPVSSLHEILNEY